MPSSLSSLVRDLWSLHFTHAFIFVFFGEQALVSSLHSHFRVRLGLFTSHTTSSSRSSSLFFYNERSLVPYSNIWKRKRNTCVLLMCWFWSKWYLLFLRILLYVILKIVYLSMYFFIIWRLLFFYSDNLSFQLKLLVGGLVRIISYLGFLNTSYFGVWVSMFELLELLLYNVIVFRVSNSLILGFRITISGCLDLPTFNSLQSILHKNKLVWFSDSLRP